MKSCVWNFALKSGLCRFGFEEDMHDVWYRIFWKIKIEKAYSKTLKRSGCIVIRGWYVDK